jgi:hypothetical protein
VHAPRRHAPSDVYRLSARAHLTAQSNTLQAEARVGAPACSAGDAAALDALAADGEAPLAATKLPQYLAAAAAALAHPLGVTLLHAASESAPQSAVLALDAPVATLGACAGDAALAEKLSLAERKAPGIVWWAARAAFAQQRALGKPSLSLLRALVHLHAAADASPMFDPATCSGYGGHGAAVRALRAAHALEAAQAWQWYGYHAKSARALTSAGNALGVTLRTEGALGKRTEAQAEATAQLVLRVERTPSHVAAQCDSASDTRAAVSVHYNGHSNAAEVRKRVDTPHKNDGASAALAQVSQEGQEVEQVRPRLPEGDQSWAGWADDSGVHAVPRLEGDAAGACHAAL